MGLFSLAYLSCYHAGNMERIPSTQRTARENPPRAIAELEDYTDNETLYTLLARLPKELRQEHLTRIEHLNDDEAEGYLYALHERRDAAIRESNVSDEELKPYFEEHKRTIWESLETSVFTDEQNHIGAGTTARIKSFDLSSFGPNAPVSEVAVKYLVTPNSKTLSASGEHDMVVEVEQMQAIEQAEIEANGTDTRVRVPHPYFHYRKGKIQCYGMERIDGVNLEQGAAGRFDSDFKDALRSALKDVKRDTFMNDIDRFFDTMHSICLHGDIKPRNLMISRDGTLYIIDFGQSVLATHVDEKSQSAFEELKEMEKRSTKDALRFFLDRLFAD